MSVTGVPLFELLQPPEGYRTVGALGTTYSADLVVCVAALAALDGVCLDRAKVGKVDAIRAMSRLQDRVRIVVHEGRVAFRDGHDPRLVSLLDRVIRTVPFDGRRQSFHPKVFVAKQHQKGNPDRFVLYVGSRNLTGTLDWDLGVGLVGTQRGSPPAGTKRLPGLQAFVDGVRALVSDEALGSHLKGLDEVWWELPAGVDGLEFGFHAGKRRAFRETALAGLPTRGRALLLSPFLDTAAVAAVVKGLDPAAEVRLVAGRSELDVLAQSSLRGHLSCCGGRIDALSMSASTGEAQLLATEAEAEEEGDDAEQKGARNLHAKVFCVDHEGRSAAVVGSANLTNHAWTGENWEAYLVVRGDASISEALWEWSKQATPYRNPPAPGPTGKKARDTLDDLRNGLAIRPFRLLERPGTNPSLECQGCGDLLAACGLSLQVSRLSTPGAIAVWPPGSDCVELETCRPSERTAFIRVEACRGTEKVSWVQLASVTPSIPAERDRDAVVQVLGADFLSYLASLLGVMEFDGGGVEPTAGRRRGSAHGGAAPACSPFRLEDLVRRLGSDRSALDEVDSALQGFREALSRASLQQHVRADLEKFSALWAAVYAGLRIP